MNSRKSVKSALLCGTVLAATATAFGAQAQQAARPAPAPGQNVIQEVVVTAQRRNERLEDVPMSITAITPQDIAKSGVTSIHELSRVTPGAQINLAGAFTQPSIRGVTTLTNGTNVENNVAIYIDGFYNPNSNDINMDLANLSGVQVLKGPQGTLYGRNATGGAILITTLEPSSVWTGKIEGTYARFNDRRLSGYVSGPISEQMRFSLAGYTRDSDGYIKKADPANPGQTKGDAAPIDQRSVRFKLQGDITDDLQATLGLNYNTMNDTRGILFSGFEHVPPTIPLAVRAPGFGTAAFNGVNRNLVITQEGTLTVRWNSDIGTLTSYTGFAHRKNKSAFDPDGTFANNVISWISLPQDTFQQAIDFNYTGIENLDLVVGGMYFHDNIKSNPGVTVLIPPAPAASTNNFFSQHTEALAFYVDGTYNFNEKWSLTLGGRYSYDDKKFVFLPINLAGNIIVAPPNPQVGPIPPFTVDTRFQDISRKFTPRAVLRYSIDERTNVYASYSKGFRSGAFNASGATDPRLITPTEPETITAYEVGFKMARSKVRFDMAAFYYDYKNLNVSLTVPNPFCTNPSQCSITTLFANAPKAEIYGLDGQAVFTPIENLNVRIGAAYLHARYGNFPGASGTGVNPATNLNVSPQIQDWSDKQMARAPNFSGNIGVDYTIEDVFGGSLDLAGNYNYTDSYVVNNASLYGPLFLPANPGVAGAQRFRQGAYSLVSIQATWTDPTEHYWVTAFCNNLFDKTYRMVYSGSVSAGDYSTPAEPQVYGVKVGYKF
ncbi:TonB-dependent receptor [Phenylobacterium sp. LjRoot219]|uniref:TonB-dependent receptor n=1 Tax=Phenylobacterium sp. LjRoot219 TaxID=3342283 RepID=UPI003ECCDBC6